MTKRLCAVLILALAGALPVQGAYMVRISGLQYPPTPPNLIRVVGHVACALPLIP